MSSKLLRIFPKEKSISHSFASFLLTPLTIVDTEEAVLSMTI